MVVVQTMKFGQVNEVPDGYTNDDHLNDLEMVVRALRDRETNYFGALETGYSHSLSHQFENIVVPGTNELGNNTASVALDEAEDAIRTARGFHNVQMYPEAHKHIVRAAGAMTVADGYIGTTHWKNPTTEQQQLIDDENLDYPPARQARAISDDYGRKYL